MKFSGIQKTTLIDYPDEIATVLFTAGCNLRCPYCHNWSLVLEYDGPYISEDEVIEILEGRKHFIRHIAITGGEPTIHKKLPKFLARLKSLGYGVKLDSNGTLPNALTKCLPHIDYVAVDVKTSIELYPKLGAKHPEKLLDTINMLINGDVDYEFRCTTTPTFVNLDTIHRMGEMVEGAKRFVFQQFNPENTLDPECKNVVPYKKEEISKLADIMASYVEEVPLRV